MATSYDVLIRGGKVIDGTGNPWFYGDVALAGDRVAAVAPRGRIDPANAREVVDAAGHVVSPGFIDIQSHSILPLFAEGRSLSKIARGDDRDHGRRVNSLPFQQTSPTPLGSSIVSADATDEWESRARGWTRFRAWLEAIEQRGASVNIGSFVGGATVREYAMGWDMREATTDELATMKRVMDECMREGAFGVAAALIYPPGSYATTDELVEVCKVIASHGGVYISHIRSEADLLLEGMAEAIEIGRRSGVAVEVYHLKASGKQSWQLMPRAMEMIDEARAAGINITSDMYPYVASGTGLTTLVPNWASEGGKLYENLADDRVWAVMRAEMIDPPLEAPSMSRAQNLEGVMPVGFVRSENRHYIGKRLPEIAAERGEEWPDTVRAMLLSEHQRI